MENIFEPNDKFDFSKLSLGQPQVIQSSNYFTKLSLNNKDFFIQLPKCKTKQGIINNEKKMHTDLLYDSFSNYQLSEWIENLEKTCQNLIFNKRNIWFTDNIELNDIESAFNNIIKYQKNGKQMLIKCYINKPQTIKSNPLCVVYDENEKLLSINDVTFEKDIIPLVKIEGIRFSSRSFQIELTLVQIMILKEEEQNQCLIKIKNDKNENQIENNENSNYLENDLLNKNNDFNNDFNDLNDINDIKDSNKNCNDNNTNNNIDIDNKNINDSQSNDSDDDNDSNDDNANDDDNVNDDDNYKKKSINTFNNETIHNKNEINEVKNYTTNESKNESNDDCLEIVDFNIDEIKDVVKLKKPNEIYYEIYRAAREKAKLAKKIAIESYLEAKNIKTKYMLDDLDESDDELSTIEKL